MHRSRISTGSALAVLGSILFAILLVAFSNLVFAPRAAQPCPAIVLPTRPRRRPRPPRAAAPKEEPLPALLAKADAKKGEQDAKICTTCHNFEKGAGPKIGPAALGRRRPSGRLGRRLRLFRFAQGRRRRLDLREARTMDHQSEGDRLGHQDGLRRRNGTAEARRHPGLSADALGLAGPVPEVSRSRFRAAIET